MFASLTNLLAPTPAGRRTPARSAPLGVELLETREVPAGLSADWVAASPGAPPESPVVPAARGYDVKAGPKL